MLRKSMEVIILAIKIMSKFSDILMLANLLCCSLLRLFMYIQIMYFLLNIYIYLVLDPKYHP